MAANRVRMLAIVQEQALDRHEIRALQDGALQVYRKHFGERFRILPLWISVPAGQAYIAGRPSTASTVSLPVPDGTPDSGRHAYMSDFCAMWMNVTGCGENEIILTAMDQRVADDYARTMLSRIAPERRRSQLLKMAWRLVRSRFSMGHLTLSINLNS